MVVGGGPVGLAAALTLSRPPHRYDVTLLEQSPGSVGTYNPARSYLYNVNARGLEWFQDHPRALQKLQQRGVAQTGFANMVTIPADPEKPIQLPKPIAMANAAGDISKTSNNNNNDSNNNPRTSYWIPRHAMVQVLTECCEEQQKETLDENCGTIDIYNGKKVDTLTTTVGNSEDGKEDLVVVHCKDGSTYQATLVVAADGIDSQVRQYLATTQAHNDASSTQEGASWLHAHNPKQFQVRRYHSPSTGVKLKALQLPPNFVLNNTDGSHIVSKSSTMYVFRSVHQGSRNRVALGCLPMRDDDSAAAAAAGGGTATVRPANTNTPFDHELWSLQTGAQAKAWFVRAFPRVPWDEWIDDREWERFAREPGTTFPPCQYSPGSAVSNGHGTGIVLAGDACHAFPPDIGQGINAGLQDVVVLDRALRGCDLRTGAALAATTTTTPQSPLSLAQALQVYQRNRGPEHRALIRLARFGAPYQYRQPWKRHRLGSALWTANVVLRALLHKVTFGRVPPAAILMAQGNALTFRQVMRRADATTWALRGLVVMSLVWFIRSRLVF